MGNNLPNMQAFYTQHDGNRGIDFHFRFCLPQEEINLLRELVVQKQDAVAFRQHVLKNWSHFFQLDLEDLAVQFFHTLRNSRVLEIERPAIPFAKLEIDPPVPEKYRAAPVGAEKDR